MTIWGLVTVLGFLIVVATVVVILGQCVRLKWKVALRTLTGLAVVLAVYGVVLAGVGMLSSPSTLKMGEEKCFDDWCVTLNGFERQGAGYVLHLETINRGRRAQRPDTPRMFLVVDDALRPLPCDDLPRRLDGSETLPISLPVPIPDTARHVSLLVTEGGFPSVLTIDDENSPFHAKRYWTIR